MEQLCAQQVGGGEPECEVQVGEELGDVCGVEAGVGRGEEVAGEGERAVEGGYGRE